MLIAAVPVLACVTQVGPAPATRTGAANPRPAASPTAAPSRVVGLAYGGSFCALREDGRVVCWGKNRSSSLGDGTNEARSRPALLAGLDGVRELRGISPNGFCALRGDASLWCWGFGNTGVATVPAGPVVPRSIARDVVAFGFAERFPGVCVRRSDGAAACTELTATERGECLLWPDETRSSCLFWRRGIKAVSRPLSQAGEVSWGGGRSSQGSHPACVLEGGVVRCRGGNDAGALGDPSRKRSEDPVAVPGMTDVVSLSSTGTSSCAVRADGSAWCWGRNVQGELAVNPDARPCTDGGVPVACNRTPTRLPVDQVAQILLDAQTFVITREGALIASRREGPPDGARTVLEPLAGFPPVATIVAGSLYPQGACAITRAGDVHCRGYDADVGDGSRVVARHPVQIAGLRGAVQVQVDIGRACAAAADGTVSCWGDDAPPRGLRDIVTVTPPCALARDGRVWCWGNNVYGEMGLGYRGRRGRASDGDIAGVPLPVPGLRDVREISSFMRTTCAVDAAGVVRCWGLGGPRSPTLSPAKIHGLPSIDHIWVSQNHQCGLSRDHEVWCWKTGAAPKPMPEWGRPSVLPTFGGAPEADNESCLVDGERTLRCIHTPAPLPALTHVSQLSLGNVHPTGIARGCAVLDSGALHCWGPAYCAPGAELCEGPPHWNKLDMLLTDVRQVSVGSYLACAVRRDGTVWCWGPAGSGLGEAFPPSARTATVDLDHAR